MLLYVTSVKLALHLQNFGKARRSDKFNQTSVLSYGKKKNICIKSLWKFVGGECLKLKLQAKSLRF
ncbi:hypothetical protein X777_04772 [Ooceraea biroi]|uniref:Uncharacterized protein n=1 Tax=Ooceraea biroi TaxID=2015173 RepID=A0A026WJM3_OOCBI|nr:hypothetical protein X777_04772 [Ooceraea biroi]